MKLTRERWINELACERRTWLRPLRALRSRSFVRARRVHATFPYSAGLAAVAFVSALTHWLGPELERRRRALLRL